jgi:hypothetical protein
MSKWDSGRIAPMLNESAKSVHDAVRGRLESGHGLDLYYDHPMLQTTKLGR